MIFSNAKIYTPNGYVTGGFEIEAGRFSRIIPGDVTGGDADLCGAKVIPGLIDIHTHGNSGMDFSDGNAEGLRKMAEYSAKRGITGFAPTSMTLPFETLCAAFQTAKLLHDNPPAGCARIVGIHMEGPFFSVKKKGAQNAAYLRNPDFDFFKRLFDISDGLVRIVDIAPELPGAVDFVKEAKKYCTVSVAHTDANYDDAAAVFEAGADHLTHLFNAMPSLHHRSPGVIGAACERQDVIAELICDGLHVHPSAVRMAFKLFPDRICLISDSLRCCGMPDGEYELGGQEVFLKGGVARLSDGTIAGAASDLFADFVNAVRFGIPEETAIRAATEIPARAIGIFSEVGSIEPGKIADFVVCNDKLEIIKTYIAGQEAAPDREQ